MSFTTTPISEVHLLLGGDPISFDDMEIPEDAVRYHLDGYDPYVHTPEMYREHSKKMMGHKSYETQRKAVIHSNKTRILSDETHKKMSESQKNKPPVSIETGKKISKKLKGKLKPNYPKTRKSRPMTDELRKKIREGVKRAHSTSVPTENESKSVQYPSHTPVHNNEV